MRSFLLFSVLAAFVEAQTPYGFSPSSTQPLLVTFANNTLVNRAALLPQSTVAKQPTIRLGNGSLPSTTFMQFMIDIDVPAQNGSKTTFLHLAQSNLNANSSTSSTSSSSSTTTNTTAPFANTTSSTSSSTSAAALNASLIEASYISPAPPPNSGAHRYVIMLFSQPSNFSVPAAFSSVLAGDAADISPASRSGFDINGFVVAAGLGSPIGATFFTVQNNGTSATNGTGSAKGSGNGTAAASNSTTSPPISTGSGVKGASPSAMALAGLVCAMVLGLYSV